MTEYAKSALNTVKRGAKNAKYDQDTIFKILDAGFIGYISYNYEGTAMCMPMAYARKNDKIYLHGSQKNRMLRSLLENEKVSMTVMHLDGLILARSGLHHSVSYRSVTVFGKLREIVQPDNKVMALKQVIDQMITGRWDELRPILKKEIDATLVVELTIEQAAAKIRNQEVNDERKDIDLPIWAGVIPVKQVSLQPVTDPSVDPSIEVPDHVKTYYEINS